MKQFDWTNVYGFERPGGSVFDSISQLYWKLASPAGAEGGRTTAGKVGDYIPLADVFESDLIRPAAVLRTIAADIHTSMFGPSRSHKRIIPAKHPNSLRLCTLYVSYVSPIFI